MSTNSNYDDFTKRELIEYIAFLVEQQNRTLVALSNRLNAIEKTDEWVADGLVALEKKIDEMKPEPCWWEKQSPTQPYVSPNPTPGIQPYTTPLTPYPYTNPWTWSTLTGTQTPQNYCGNVIHYVQPKPIDPEDGDWHDPVPYA